LETEVPEDDDRRDVAVIKASAPSTAVQVRGLSKQFASRTSESTQALDMVDLNVQEHEFVSLLGPSGCGKSTLLKIVAGLIKPTDGEVRIFGEPVDGPIESLGYAFQEDLLLPWRDVLDNVMLQVDFRKSLHGKRAEFRDRARDLLTRVGLEGFEHHLPRQLSGGMRQRVALCRALIHDPDLLLLDEPFAAVDAITRDQIAFDLQRIWMDSRKTVIFVTHNIAEAVFLSDRVVIFSPRPGRIAAVEDISLGRPRTPADRDSEETVVHIRRIRGELQKMGLYKS
jgi:NitT/TauT family transport system ATP-binding protein